MFHSKLIVLTVVLVCFSTQISPTESGSVIEKLKGIGKAVCDFFHPSHKSSTTTIPAVEQKSIESVETETYDIDVRANVDGMGDTLGRSVIQFNSNCPPGQRLTASRQCRPTYK